MKATLSLVLTDKDGNNHHIPDVMIPIIGDTVYYQETGRKMVVPMSLIELDQITTHYTDGHDVREDPRYKDKINGFLEENESLISTFKRGKTGSLVIVFTDENGEARKMRVLYANKKTKTDVKKVLNEIKKYMENSNPKIVSDIIKTYDFMFGLNYPRERIFNDDCASPLAFYAKPLYTAISHIKTQTKLKDGTDPKALAIKTSYKCISSLLDSNNEQSKELGYYYVRLLDSHLKSTYEYETTPVVSRKSRTIKTTAGTVKTGDIITGSTSKLNKVEKGGECQQLSFFDMTQEPVEIPASGTSIIPETNEKQKVKRQDLSEALEPWRFENPNFRK